MKQNLQHEIKTVNMMRSSRGTTSDNLTAKLVLKKFKFGTFSAPDIFDLTSNYLFSLLLPEGRCWCIISNQFPPNSNVGEKVCVKIGLK